MKKRWLSILALALTAVGCCALGACSAGEKGDKGDQGIQGIQGEAGKDGVDGINGQDGKSAYQIWLDNGYTGTEADFLAWLQGDGSAEYGESLRFQKIAGKEEYRVMGMGTVSSLDIVIPATYRGLPVTEIGTHAFENETYIESLAIPDSVITIGFQAFWGCENLTFFTK